MANEPKIAAHWGADDLYPRIVEALEKTGKKLGGLVGMQAQVTLEQGSGYALPYANASFDGAYAPGAGVREEARMTSETTEADR
jgi:hypothetical protein